MKKNHITGTEKEQMILDLRRRLDWYANEAAPEEYNEAEVAAIQELLGILCPEMAEKEKTEKSLSGFWKTYGIRKSVRLEKYKLRSGEVSLADYPEDAESEENGENAGTKKKTYRFFRRTGMYKGVVAAALVVALFIGGTAGAYAQKSGVFYWLKKDKSGTEMLVAPENMNDSMNFGVNMRYNTVEEIPEEYRGYTWKPEVIPEGLEFAHYEVVKSKQWDRLLCLYRNVREEVRLEILSKIFKQDAEYYLQRNDLYKFLCSKEYNGVTLEFFKKVSEGESEYMACFYYNHVQYIVQGNLDLTEIEKLAYEYCNDVVK